MSTIDITKIIDLKQVLKEKFDTILHVHDACGGQYFSLDNPQPAGLDYIKNYFEDKKYRVIFNSDFTEFHIEGIELC